MNTPTRKVKIAIIAVFCCSLAFLAVGGTFAWARGYDGRIGPRTFVGSIEVSGMDPETARRAVEERIDAFFASGIAVELDGSVVRVPLATVGTDSSEVVRFDVDGTIAAAVSSNRDANGFWDAVRLLEARMRPTVIAVIIEGSEEAIRETVRGTFSERERLGTNATFSFAKAGGTWTAKVIAGTTGEEFDFDAFLPVLRERLANLDDTAIPIALVRRDPEVTETVARTEIDAAVAAMGRAPFALSVVEKSWVFSAEDLSKMIVPGPNGLNLNVEILDAKLAEIAAEVDIPAVNARFEREDGRVVEFASSAVGRAIDRDRAKTDLVASLNSPSVPTVTPLVLVDVEPTVTTAQGNDLGISDALGTGTSSFKGSPKNRVGNIQNGVNLLNGLLIAPGETFSLLDSLKPFELDNGYLPELVIKGDKIIPEIAGGLCQIGTTTFRAVMNSGLDVVQRRNHSLVVNYYNDPSNNNPGTDATIYDPAPDFQFKNDTGHYVLFEAKMDAEAQSLAFTLWGTSDGRMGSYTPPVVTRWIGVGPTVETETLTLPPGEKKCQAAHVGANTSFTYTVAKPDGTSVDRLFESHYRPLPQICLVGVEELSTPETLQPAEDSVSSLITTDAPVTD